MTESKNKQITKNQHYIPQCLLKHFSKDDKGVRKINIFDVKRSSFRNSQSIKNVFSQNYFYDKDNSVESILGNIIESPNSLIIDSIIRGETNIVRESVNWLNLLKFIAVLCSRTPQARDLLISFTNQHLISFSKELFRLNDIDPKKADNLSIKIQDQSSWASVSALQGYFASILLSDLQIHIINNKTLRDFILSDHPVFMYNWFYKNTEHPGITGWQSRGLQIFLPISPKITLCLYDESVYKYGVKNKCSTDVNDCTDIDIINSFQIFNTESILGFFSEQDNSYISSMFDRYKNTIIYSHVSDEYQIENLNSENIKTRHVIYTKQLKISRMPTFVRIRKQLRKEDNVYKIRCAEILDAFYSKTNELKTEELK
jgi:Protein of unknown function (DUF4238)